MQQSGSSPADGCSSPPTAAACVVNTCREGHTGPLCASCKPGYGKRLVTGLCFKCSGDQGVLKWLLPFFTNLPLVILMAYKSTHVEKLKSAQTGSFIFFVQTAFLPSTSLFFSTSPVSPRSTPAAFLPIRR